MKKKVLLILAGLVFIVAAAVIYLNNVFLPLKVRDLLIEGLEKQTGKHATLGSLRLNIFKGLVLRDLALSDETRTLISVKEASCTFIPLPIFQNKLIIPTIRLKSPQVFLERQADNTLNLADLFGAKKEGGLKRGLNFFIYKISITGGTLVFKDSTLEPAFSRQLTNVNAAVFLSLPASIKFSLKAGLDTRPETKINAAGQFRIPSKQLTAKIYLKDLALREFAPYYQHTGLLFPAGRIDAQIEFSFAPKLLGAQLQVECRRMRISKDKISAALDANLKSSVKYSLDYKQAIYSGSASVNNANISGLGPIDTIDNLNGQLNFSNAGLSGDNLTALVWGFPVQAGLNITDFSRPVLSINLISSFDLAALEKALKDKLKLVFPATVKGQAQLNTLVRTRLPVKGPPEISGHLQLQDAAVKIDKIASPVENINGRLQFSQNQLKWYGLNFKYLDTAYTSQGVLTDFKNPGVQLALASGDLSLESMFAINNRLVNLSACRGRYLNSDFSIKGAIDTAPASGPLVDIDAALAIDLKDAPRLLKKFRAQIEKARPEGLIRAKVNLAGNINKIKSCVIRADLASDAVSAYGFHANNLRLIYSQADGLADIAPLGLAAYGGTLDASARLNLNSENLPFLVNADIRGLRLEQLKMDTAIKSQDISGALQAQFKLSGFFSDLNRLSGQGVLFINDGRLWQLNLFKGIGSLVFVSDFSSIVFNEGSCGFIIQDRNIFTDNLRLKSTLADLAGSCRIGFDGSVDAAINVQVNAEAAPQTGSIKDIATAIIGQAGRFGVITISGTLKEPKFKFQAAVVDIIKTLKDTFLNKSLGNP